MIEKIATDPTVQHAQELYIEAIEQRVNAIMLLRHIRSNLSCVKPEAMAVAQEVYGKKSTDADTALLELANQIYLIFEEKSNATIERLEKQIVLLQTPPSLQTDQQS